MIMILSPHDAVYPAGCRAFRRLARNRGTRRSAPLPNWAGAWGVGVLLVCLQPQAQVRVDQFRLYEGPYTPYQEAARDEISSAAVHLFDVPTPAAGPLSAEALASRTGWTEVAEDDLSHVFSRGAAVFLNSRVAVVLRLGAPGIEVYSLGPGAPVLRGTLAPDGREADNATVGSFATTQNDAAAGGAEVTFRTRDGVACSLRCSLKAGEPVVETEPRVGVAALRVEAPCRFLVLPDFFADDIVVDARELPVREAELPGDNLLLHLLPDGQAILLTAAKTSDEDIRVALAGEGGQRRITASEVQYGKGGKIWVAVLAAPGIWRAQDIERRQAGKVLRLDWLAPFPAQWRADWRRDSGLTDSWEMFSQRADGQYVKYGIYGGPETIPADRKRWTTVLGTFEYPCWLASDRQGFLQPLLSQALRFEGPAVIYPLNRAPATPLDTFTVVDILRNTLGVGPCEYVLDVENQHSQYRGRATCSVRDTLNPIYSRGDQKQRRAEIERTLQDLMIFIRHIRGRIEGYLAFDHETLAYLAEQQTAHPELAEHLGQLEAIARTMDARFDARRAKIKTPDDAAKMVEEFKQTVLDYDGADALAKCRQFTEGWVDIGGNQDELVGECRWVVKMIRQKAGLLVATDPRMADIGKELRRRSQFVLRNPAIHEGARH